MANFICPICCGLDVQKNVIVTTIVTTNGSGISEYNYKSFSNINSDIQKFRDWLIENNCKYVCMESTGKYWIPVLSYLENDIEVCLTHPKYVKAIKGKKKSVLITKAGAYLKPLMNPHYTQSIVTLNEANVFAYLEPRGYDTSLLVKCNDD